MAESSTSPHASTGNPPTAESLSSQLFGVFRYSRRALGLVWSTNRLLTVALGSITLIAGLLPASIAFVGQLLVDGVIAAVGDPSITRRVLWLVAMEAGLVAVLAAAQSALSICQSLLRAQLGHNVNVLILEKAQQMELAQLEDAEFYDRLTRARREASQRPLSLINRTFGLIQNLIAILSFSGLLLAFSPWAVLILVAGGLPVFAAEAKFAGDAFRLFRWRAPETRRLMYLETVLAREDYTKEVKLFGLAPLLLDRYRRIFQSLYKEDRQLTLRRGFWSVVLGLIGTAALYFAYGWVVLSAVAATITIGQMTMYLMVFKQGQSAVSASLSSISGMYEDNLYLSMLYEFLEQPGSEHAGTALSGPEPDAGIEIRELSFTYPDSERPALSDINLTLRPGCSLALVGENGSGKTTLTKLIAGLYPVEQGDILLDGRSLNEWKRSALQQRIGVIFQDFARYQWIVGENIGAGDVSQFSDEEQWRRAAEKGLADPFIQDLPQGYETQLGRWFGNGRELSGGQWQKIALSRAFMREDADILILDEPTATMDAQAEADIFNHFQSIAGERILILISHRFSTVRMANQIAVLDQGRIVELGSHTDLMSQDGRYAHLFRLQAAAYQ